MYKRSGTVVWGGWVGGGGGGAEAVFVVFTR